ncbi:hypothetical protein GWC77_05065 [Paraburkholderia sp. NMBU_R16]|uniref:hypothetical protein n=1 Tax=Paraburkholderia sp. NMBU_R16 TaxID=2698676 RepID=UPI001564AE5A|nr:hypothetical protein [Paraburkholderia sp. NMBU_R16]NRO95307.1 hypothetical protein [Paraburkholderia sp. NMBU_R16]
MRLISAALLGAAATLPALVYATTTIPDPTDAAVPVPAVTVPSAFDGYRAYREGDGPAWQQLNRDVLDKSTMTGMKHGAMPGKPVDNANAHRPTHGGPAK